MIILPICADQESFARGGPTLATLFSFLFHEGREDSNSIKSGQSSALQQSVTWVSKYNYFANSTYNQFEYEDLSIINTIQVKFSSFLCHIVSYAKLLGCGGKLSRAS